MVADNNFHIATGSIFWVMAICVGSIFWFLVSNIGGDFNYSIVVFVFGVFLLGFLYYMQKRIMDIDNDNKQHKIMYNKSIEISKNEPNVFLDKIFWTFLIAVLILIVGFFATSFINNSILETRAYTSEWSDSMGNSFMVICNPIGDTYFRQGSDISCDIIINSLNNNYTDFQIDAQIFMEDNYRIHQYCTAVFHDISYNEIEYSHCLSDKPIFLSKSGEYLIQLLSYSFIIEGSDEIRNGNLRDIIFPEKIRTYSDSEIEDKYISQLALMLVFITVIINIIPATLSFRKFLFDKKSIFNQ